MSVVLVRRLFDLQIIQGEDYISEFQARTTKDACAQEHPRKYSWTETVDILASNVLSYSLTLEDNGTYDFYKGEESYIKWCSLSGTSDPSQQRR